MSHTTIIRNRLRILIIFLSVFGVALGQKAGFKSMFESEQQIRSYFANNIMLLDPLEGEYDIDGAGEYVTPFVHQYYPHSKYKLYIVCNNNQFKVYAKADGDFDESNFRIEPVGETNAYWMYYHSTATRIYLQDNLHFSANFKLDHASAKEFTGNNRLSPSVSILLTNDCVKVYPTATMYANAARKAQEEAKPTEWTGTGFALNNNYVVTNYHVVEDAKTIFIQGINGDFNHKYSADVVTTDKYNDLAIIKVKDVDISSVSIPYAIKTGTSEVGEEVFVLGYPLTSTMGEEIKLTTGVISSKTGFQGDVSIYQISAPIQPGNSGGPLFDSKGNVVGIVSAKHKGAENVGYAIKTSYLKNLMESTVSTNILPQTNRMGGQNLSGKVKLAKNYVYYITCSSRGYSSSSANYHSNSLPKQVPIERTPINVNTIIQRILSNMVPVSGGDFIMINFEGTEEKISIPNFSIGRYEITQEEWQAIMKTNPCNSSGQVGPKIPIFNVSWEDCQEFIKRLNNITGKKFRLPTEEEWEYAASGGQESHNYKFSGSNQSDAVAWYSSNCDKKIHNVGEKLQNELGLFDMSGNVKEWCGDIIDNSKIQTLRWTPGNSRIIRGGSWLSGSQECGVSVRNFVSPDVRDVGVGFRIAQ